MSSQDSETAGVSMHRLYAFYHDMHAHHIMLTYGGDFTQEITRSVLSMTERKLMADYIGEQTRKKIFNVMIESLQNICKHQPEANPELHGIKSVFMIGYHQEAFLLISGNPIHKSRSADLSRRIGELNAMDKEQIKEHYRQTRLNNSLSQNSGAGLGFIDMVKRTGNPLTFQLDRLSEHFDYFTLLVKVSHFESD